LVESALNRNCMCRSVNKSSPVVTKVPEFLYLSRAAENRAQPGKVPRRAKRLNKGTSAHGLA